MTSTLTTRPCISDCVWVDQDEDRETWLAYRKEYALTATKLAPILGLGFISRAELYRQMHHGKEAVFTKEQMRIMEIGRKKEAPALGILEKILPGAYEKVGLIPSIRDKRLAASLDSVVLRNGRFYNVEVKCREGAPWDEIPAKYLLQMLFQMYCAQIESTYFFVHTPHADGLWEVFFSPKAWHGLCMPAINDFLGLVDVPGKMPNGQKKVYESYLRSVVRVERIDISQGTGV